MYITKDTFKHRQILEIKSVIWEIKRDKFWKSKVSFEKSNASNFGNQKCIWEIKRDKLLQIKIVIGEIKRDKFKIKMTQ